MRKIQDSKAILLESENFLIPVDFEKEDYDHSFNAVQSIVDITNLFFYNQIRIDEIPEKMIEIYYVDYYITQMMNGGFSQFAVNSLADKEIFSYIESGLSKIGATKNLDLFLQNAKKLSNLDRKIFDNFTRNYANSDRNEIVLMLLTQLDDHFFDLNNDESYRTLNKDPKVGEHISPLLLRWIVEDENLVVASHGDIAKEIKRRADQIAHMNWRRKKLHIRILKSKISRFYFKNQQVIDVIIRLSGSIACIALMRLASKI